MKKHAFMKKTALLLLIALIIGAFPAFSQSFTQVSAADRVELIAQDGDLETACVTWKAVTNATEYRVYIAAEGGSYIRLDDQLIRFYGTYYRADALGLKAGRYTLKVEAYRGSELISHAVSSTVTVVANDRSGYAFVKGTSSGAYNEDGTLKSNAVVIYITDSNQDTVKASIDMSGKGTYTECTGIRAILLALKKGKEKRPFVLRLIGNIGEEAGLDTDSSFKGDWCIENNNTTAGITIEGVGNDAVANGWGIRVKNASNVEIRNIGFMNCNSDEGDNIGLQQGNDHIWVHNCDMFYGDAGKDSDQVKGDGALDCKLSTYVTFSYNHFWDNGKCNLLGLKEGSSGNYFITYHHNWYDHSDSRHPRVRFYSAHVYNNYYDGNAKYGVGATQGSSVFVENNYFRNCQYPILTSMQGSDVFAGDSKRDVTNNATFSKEPGGSIKATGNFMTGTYTFIPYGAGKYILKGQEVSYNLSGTTSAADFDAIVLDRDEKADSSIHSYSGSNTYNNFDTAPDFYSYNVDPAENVPAIVTKWSGRAYGGDFRWTFNNSTDDTSSAVNAALKSAIVNYKSSLVSVGTGSSVPVPTNAPLTTPTDAPASGDGQNNDSTISAGSTVLNFTLEDQSGSPFTINGNFSKDKGTVSYAGLTLTRCLKMESSTSISFNTSAKSSLVLVFNNDFNGKTKIDGNAVNATGGILSVDLEKGSHTITKGDTANLYYITLKQTETAPEPTVIPTAVPTEVPTTVPTTAPTMAPTVVPTAAPTAAPTEAPAEDPGTTEAPRPTDLPVSNAEPTKSPIVIPGLVTPSPVPEEAVPTETPVPTIAPQTTGTPVQTPDPVPTPTTAPSKTEERAGGRTPVYIAITILLTLAAGGVIVYMVVRKKK